MLQLLAHYVNYIQGDLDEICTDSASNLAYLEGMEAADIPAILDQNRMYYNLD